MNLKQRFYNRVNKYLTSHEYMKHNVKLPMIVENNEVITIKQLPQGIIMLEQEPLLSKYEFGNYEISYFNKIVAVPNPGLKINSDVRLDPKTRNKSYRKNINLWKKIFPSKDNNNIFYSYDNLSIRMSIADNNHKFINYLNRDELYCPVAFLEGHKIIGGLYIYLWCCGKNGTK